MTDLILDSLQRRMAAMHSLYYQAVDAMDLEHVNHFARPLPRSEVGVIGRLTIYLFAI